MGAAATLHVPDGAGVDAIGILSGVWVYDGIAVGADDCSGEATRACMVFSAADSWSWDMTMGRWRQRKD